MKANVTTNVLLTIIAACLVLITAKLCNIGFVPSANAQGNNQAQGVLMMNSLPSLTPVALYAKNTNGRWYPCQVTSNGTLVVSQ